MNKNLVIIAFSTLVFFVLLIVLSSFVRYSINGNKQSLEQSLFIEQLASYTLAAQQNTALSALGFYTFTKENDLFYGSFIYPSNNIDGLFVLYTDSGNLNQVFMLKPTHFTSGEQIKNSYLETQQASSLIGSIKNSTYAAIETGSAMIRAA